MLSNGAGAGVLNVAVKITSALVLTNKQKIPLILE